MPQSWMRVGGGLLVFLAIGLVGLAGLAGLDPDRALESFAVVMAVAIPSGVAAYAGLEYLQTGRIESITRQFDTRTLVLIPAAMALNIVLGTIIANVLKVPIYLDSIGTIMVAALAGPLAGAATGFLANVAWTWLAPPPFQSPFAAPFAVVAVVVGLLAGTFARWGWLRPRRGWLVSIVAAGVITGVAAAFVAAPIAAGIFGGVTGSGADFVIAAFRQAGADLQAAVLAQSLISDPIDKVLTFFAAYVILAAMAARTKARFPQGHVLLPATDAEPGTDPGP